MITLLIIIALIAAFPVGYLLAYLTKEELVSGRKWFVILGFSCLILSLIIAFLNISAEIKFSLILTLFFIAIAAFVSVYMSYNKKFTSIKSRERLR